MNSDKPPVDEVNPSPVLRDYSTASDVLLVSFSGLKRSPEKIPGFSLRGTLVGMPAKKLYVRDLDKAWFLRGLRGVTRDVPQTVEFFRNEVAETKARRVVFTGYSLGGYAALLYGVLCGVHEVHAISPQTFLGFWKRWRAGDHRWRRYVLPLHFSNTRRYHDLRPWLARDMPGKHLHVHVARDSRLDRLHSAHVGGLPSIITHEYEKGSHRLVTVLRESGELRALLDRAVSG